MSRAIGERPTRLNRLPKLPTTATDIVRSNAKPKLMTPPLPPDLPQWGTDGRFRNMDHAPDAADLTVGDSLPDRYSFAVASTMKERFFGEAFRRHESYPVFDSPAEEDKQRRKNIVKHAMKEIAERKPRMGTNDMIQVAAEAAGQFQAQFRDIPLRFPLGQKDAAALNHIVASCIAELEKRQRVPLAPPGVPASMGFGKIVPMHALTSDVMEGFREVKMSHRNRIERMFATYDPTRLREVDSLLEKASNMGFAGAEEDLLQSLVRLYGPEPHDPNKSDPAVVISDPVLNAADVSVTIYASVRGDKTDVPSWSLSMGNRWASTPMGLDALASLGVASAEVVSSADLGEFDRALTLCLTLRNGAVRQGTQYTVYLALLGAGGVKARDSKTFFVDRDPPPPQQGR